MTNLYIYYQVREEHASALCLRVAAMQAALAGSEGVKGRLLRRPQAPDGLHTWMEVYEAGSPGFEAALAAAVDEAALAAMIEGGRHIEVFTEISSTEINTCA